MKLNVGQKIGLSTAAGYYEATVINIDEQKPTAKDGVNADWYMFEVDEYFHNVAGINVYINEFSLEMLKVRELS